MTFVLMSFNRYVKSRSISTKMGVLDVKNVQNSGFLAIISVSTFFRVRVTKNVLGPHFSIFFAETFRIPWKYHWHFDVNLVWNKRNIFHMMCHALFPRKLE